MENLNKENFWNELMALYPNEVKHFCNWIDQYKKENDWNVIVHSALKFHHIPLSMQLGILLEYSGLFRDSNPLVMQSHDTINNAQGIMRAWFGVQFFNNQL